MKSADAASKKTLKITRAAWEAIGKRMKWAQAGRLPVEELQQTWEEDENGEYIQVNDNGEALHMAHGVVAEKIPVMYGSVWAGIQAWCKKKRFWPNIWSVNERGNVTLRSKSGADLGGLV